MHSAPAVSYPVGRSHFQGSLVALAGLGGALTGLLWCFQVTTVGWRQWLYFVILLASCLFALLEWRRSPRGTLRWDGSVWTWICSDVSVCGVVTVQLDLQFCLVLSMQAETGARIWLCPERRVDLTRWNTLRCAVFSRGGAPQAQQARAEGGLLQIRS